MEAPRNFSGASIQAVTTAQDGSNHTAIINCGLPQNVMDSSLCPLSAAVLPITDKILLPLVTTVGIIGNVLNLLTLTRKEMRSSSSKTLQLLVIMSSNDLVLLLLQIPQFLTHFAASVKSFYSFYYVYVRYPLSNTLLTCNVWLTVAITIERCVAFTKRSGKSGTKRCARPQQSCRSMLAMALQSGKHIGFALLATSAALNLPKFFERQVVIKDSVNDTVPIEEIGVWSHVSTAFGANPTYQKVSFWATAIFVNVVPMLALVVLTCLLVFRVEQHRKRKQRLAEWRTSTQPTAAVFDYEAACTRPDEQLAAANGVSAKVKRMSSNASAGDIPSTPESPEAMPPTMQIHSYLGTGFTELPRKANCYVPNTITILVVCIVVVFILTDCLPFYLISLFAIFGRDEVWRLDTTQAMRHISNLLVVTNSSINFILFCSTSKKYRAVFLHRLCRIQHLSGSRAI